MSVIELRKSRIPDNMLKPYYQIGALEDYQELSEKYDLFLMLIERLNILNLDKDYFVVGLEGELFDLGLRGRNESYSSEEIFPCGLDMRFLFDFKGYYGLIYLSESYLTKNIARIDSVIKYSQYM